MSDRNDPVIRKGALLLSSLVLTPDEGLAAYGDRRVGNEDVDPEQLKQAREILDAVGFVLQSGGKDDWQKLQPGQGGFPACVRCPGSKALWGNGQRQARPL